MTVLQSRSRIILAGSGIVSRTGISALAQKSLLYKKDFK
jgi:hypothetical protein